MLEEKHNFGYYLNPLVWIRCFISHVITFVLIVNHFFVLILACVIIILTALFFYDRYAVATYDESVPVDSVDGFFSEGQKYDSPLARGDKYLFRELEAHYDAEERKKEVEQARKEYERLEQKEGTSLVRDMKPILSKEEKEPKISISEEVRHRLKIKE